MRQLINTTIRMEVEFADFFFELSAPGKGFAVGRIFELKRAPNDNVQLVEIERVRPEYRI
jgi:hypothetical protein